ncbi:NudC domain-containing protein 1 [Caenorhabditis elegans]|uniref:NudC domain-containing protein 1 n=1 Tax=Caenorhabditis elegans TaxID=6239 RepID=A6PVA1_CAEEL|nr:NudC domain-containing protein 1 [Caenorhabditis elegans]CCD67307.1 NudC domain-containing protein 1 [Caenorhabditis elegans]|eukprot:NP_491406.2 Uncharacterized protein CELE_C44E4.5 [Caenorhabditis elegans]
MQSINLPVDHSKIDANFEGYKVSMNNVHFSSKSLDQNLCLRAPSNEMITLQHMKVFSNDNQLFCDYSKCTDSQQFLYRILDTGHIQAMVYEKKTQIWNTSIVGSIDVGTNASSAFPTNLLFTENNLVVACNGISEITVFLAVSDSNWVKMLEHKVSEQGLSLIEARILNGKLNILAYHVESDDSKKTRSRIHSIRINLDDIDYADSLTVEKSMDLIQNGHFETCTFTNNGEIIFLSSEKPHVEGQQEDMEEKVEHSWEQTGNIIQVAFKLKSEISKEDVKIDTTKTGIRLIVKDLTLLSGKLSGEIDENDVEICADQKTNSLKLKLKSIDDKKWEKLISVEYDTLKSLEDSEIKRTMKGEQVIESDEPMEECDETEGSMAFYWVDQESGKVLKQCDVSGSQVLFTSRQSSTSPALICLRHDVDGLLWSFDESAPSHVATLQAFGYVQASKTSRLWSGCSPNKSLACIVEGNNRVLLYSQKVEVSGSLSNRKTSQTVSHVSKQHLLRVECSDPIRGVQLTDTHLFAATKSHIHVAELNL